MKRKLRLPKRLMKWGSLLAVLLAAAGCSRMKTLGQVTTPGDWRKAMQPPLTEDDADMLAASAILRHALRLGLERNPGVRTERERWLATIHVEPQVTSLPDPMVQFGYQFDSVETRVGPQQWNLGLSQRFPWWQKLWARGKVAANRAEIARLRYEAAMRDLIIEVKDAYYELYYLDQALPITEKIETMLRNEAILAYAEMETGRAQLNEAFRAESQAAQLAYDRILLTEQRAAQAERLRSLLNLPPGTKIGPARIAPLYDVVQETGPLYERAERYAEILKIRGLEIQRAGYDVFLAKLTRIPDITVGTNYIETGRSRASPGMRPSDSGKDPFIGILSMNLPIWEQRTRALIREKKAMEEAARRQALETANRIRQAVAQTYFQVQLTNRLARLYAETLLPQAETVMRQAEIDFRNDQAAFSSLIETTLAYHNFLLAHQRAIADHGQAIGRLEKVLGTTAEPRENEETRSAVVEEELGQEPESTRHWLSRIAAPFVFLKNGFVGVLTAFQKA